MPGPLRVSLALALCCGTTGLASSGQQTLPAATKVIRFTPPITAKVMIPRDVGATSPLAWFFELTDGSKCRPLAAPGRIVDGERELYACKYGSAGEADAVLGELDSSAPVWTIHKVLINKKTEPQTIKSLAIASVRAVWQ